MFEWLTLMLRIQEFPGSDAGQEIDCPDRVLSYISELVEINK